MLHEVYWIKFKPDKV